MWFVSFLWLRRLSRGRMVIDDCSDETVKSSFRTVVAGRLDPVAWTRSLGPGRLGPVAWARSLGPGRLGPVAWARSLGPGRLGPVAKRET